jgi:hypothetical protein
MHLTNYAINKNSKHFVQNNSTQTQEMHGTGSKRHMEWFKKYLIDNNYNSDELFENIESIIIKSLICAQPSLSH